MAGTIMTYLGENSKMIMSELAVLEKLRIFTTAAWPVLIIILFLLGAYMTSKTPSKATLPEGFINIETDAHVVQKLHSTSGVGDGDATTEGFDTAAAQSIADAAVADSDRCPNILVQHGSEIFLYNSKVEKVPGVNPIRFKSLEDYSEFMDWLKAAGFAVPSCFSSIRMTPKAKPCLRCGHHRRIYRADFRRTSLTLPRRPHSSK